MLAAIVAAAAESAAAATPAAAAAAAAAAPLAAATTAAAGSGGGGGLGGDGSWWWPLLLSTLAGLSTSVGAALAVAIRPDEDVLAALLGGAIGVMATVSLVEMWWRKALEVGSFVGVTAALALGAGAFALLDPLLPDPHGGGGRGPASAGLREERSGPCSGAGDAPRSVLVARDTAGGGGGGSGGVGALVKRQGATSGGAGGSGASSPGRHEAGEAAGGGSAANGLLQQQLDANNTGGGGGGGDDHEGGSANTPFLRDGGGASGAGGAGGLVRSRSPSAAAINALRAHHAGLLRLGLLMAGTLTLHNLPEGFAVAFSAHSDVGLLLAAAIGVHNVAEGVIIAAPILLATGSRARAFAVTTASGLSEPLGALVALAFARPLMGAHPDALEYVLSATGGVMLAVCWLELYPEGRRCGRDGRMLQGALIGAALMALTLWLGA